jgi:hypothetical protein
MFKTYTMIAILTLGAPLAAAELAAPQLPLIDAAAVRAQLTDKETINIGAAFPGLQTCQFTAVKDKNCVFTCKNGSTVTRPALASSLVPNGCAKFVMVPAGNKAAVDITLARPLLSAKMQANLLRTVAVTLRGLEQQNSPDKAPADYTSGVQYASELVEEALLNMDLAIAEKNQPMLHMETLRLEPVIARLAALSESVENNANYKPWGGAAIKNIAAELDRSVREIRLNAPFAF